MTELAKAVVAAQEQMRRFGGCGDNSCVVERPAVGTNGGCRCGQDPRKARYAVAALMRMTVDKARGGS